MPEGTGGQVCTDIFEVKIMLKSDPDYVFEVVSLDAPSKPAPMKLSYRQVNERANQRALATLFNKSTSRKVAVQYPPR